MTDNEVYGQLQSEKLAKDSLVVRQIVREIDQFGINDRQRWLLIWHLGLELEEVDKMQELLGLIKELKGKEIFISRIFGADGEET